MIPGIDMFRLFISRLINKKDPFKKDFNSLTSSNYKTIFATSNTDNLFIFIYSNKFFFFF